MKVVLALQWLASPFIKICVISCDMNSTLGSVVPLAMFAIDLDYQDVP